MGNVQTYVFTSDSHGVKIARGQEKYATQFLEIIKDFPDIPTAPQLFTNERTIEIAKAFKSKKYNDGYRLLKTYYENCGINYLSPNLMLQVLTMYRMQETYASKEISWKILKEFPPVVVAIEDIIKSFEMLLTKDIQKEEEFLIENFLRKISFYNKRIMDEYN